MTDAHEHDERTGPPVAVEPDDFRLAAVTAELAAIRALVDDLAALPSKVDGLAATVGQEHERAAFRESVIDRLHAENQQLRHGELEALLQPLRSGLFRLHDMARRAAMQCRAVAELAPERGAALLEAVADETADVLVAVGVERFEAVVGEPYDPGRHRPVAATPVPEAWRDNTVAEVRSAGFAAADRVIRRADVVVARCEPAATGQDDETGEGNEQR